MSVRSFMSDDLDPSDFDTPVNVEVPSPVSIPSGLPPPDDADLTAISLADVKEINKHELTSMQSLLPLLQTLPGLVVAGSVYYIHRSIDKSDRERLLYSAACVADLTLTADSDAEASGMYPLSPGIFVRLAQLKNNEQSSLFPSLFRLCIDGASSYLDSIDLFISPSLRTLEITHIPESHQNSLWYFLELAIDEIPELNKLHLGPGSLSWDILQTCARFSNLSRLELGEIAVPFDFTLVEQIGGLLNLEALVVKQSGVGVYTSRSGLLREEEEKKERLEREAQEQARIAEEEERRNLEDEKPKVVTLSPEEAKHFEEERRFEQVRNLLRDVPYGEELAVHLEEGRRRFEAMEREASGLVFAPPPPALLYGGSLLGDSFFGACVANPGEEILAIPTVTQVPQDSDAANDPVHQARSPSPTPSEYGKSSPVLALAEPELFALLGLSESGKLFPGLKTLQISGNSDLIKDIVSAVSSDALNELQITFHGQLSEEHDHIVEFAASRWRESLVSVILKTMADPASSANKLSKSTFKKILHAENIRHIDMANWNIEDIGHGLLALQSTPFWQSKLETLLLPFHPTASGISVGRLGIIPEACRNLISLRCRLKHLSNVPEFPLGNPVQLSSAGKLEVLTIGNAEPHRDFKRLVLVARYIDVLFPNLKMIETHDGPEQNAEQWKDIFYVVDTVCKPTRFDAQHHG